MKNIAATNKNLASRQSELDSQMNKIQVSIDWSNSRGFQRGNSRGRPKMQFKSNRGNNRTPNQQSYQRQQFGHTSGNFYNQHGRGYRYIPINCKNLTCGKCF